MTWGLGKDLLFPAFRGDGLQETKDVIRSIREACAKHELCIKGLHVMVIGSERPWLEVVLLAEGAGRVTTVEYGSITSKHPQVQTMLPALF